MPEFWSTLGNTIWYALMIIVFISYLLALFSIIGDLFRDRELNGWVQAVWFFFLVFFPILTALIYLLVRGGGMAKRSEAQLREHKEATDAYIRQVAVSPADEIEHAKALLESGTITAEEFNLLKAKALS